MTVEAGWLGTVPLAAHIGLYNFISFNCMTMGGLGNALSAKAGACVGTGRGEAGKRYVLPALFLGGVYAATLVLCLWLLRDWTKFLFTSSDEVAEVTSRALPAILVYICLDMMNQTLLGAVRTLSYQDLAACLNLLSFYLVAQPLIFLAALRFKLGIVGIWGAADIGFVVLVSSYLVLVFFADWEETGRKALELVESERESQQRSEMQSERESILGVHAGETVTDLHRVPVEADNDRTRPLLA